VHPARYSYCRYSLYHSISEPHSANSLMYTHFGPAINVDDVPGAIQCVNTELFLDSFN
jgi:hypothetical protein